MLMLASVDVANISMPKCRIVWIKITSYRCNFNVTSVTMDYIYKPKCGIVAQSSELLPSANLTLLQTEVGRAKWKSQGVKSNLAR